MSFANTSQNDLVIHTVDLWRTYRVGTQQEVHALQGVDLEIKSGSNFASLWEW